MQRHAETSTKEEFEDLFAATGISSSRNQKYLDQLAKYTAKGQWARVSKLWREAPKMFNKILDDLQSRAEIRNDDDAADACRWSVGTVARWFVDDGRRA